MCDNCIPVEMPVTIWEWIDGLMCAEMAKMQDMVALEDQLRAKLRNMMTEDPECFSMDHFMFLSDRIRTRLFGPNWHEVMHS